MVQSIQESLFSTVMLGSVPISNPPACPIPQMESPEVGGWGSWSKAPLGQGQMWAQAAPVTSSLSSPQFGTPESLLRLLLMVQERLCGFPLKVSELMENLHRDADKQEPW